MEKDIIKDIPAGLEKNLGIGQMVLPSADTIRNELQTIKKGGLITMPTLRASIARQFGVTTACPKSTLSIVRSMMKVQESGAYKVINGKGELVSKDISDQIDFLVQEGFEIDLQKGKPKILNFKSHLSD